MDVTRKADAQQAETWNGAAGQAWVHNQAVTDRMFKPFEDLLVESIVREPATHLLDVGCGTGATTVALARVLDEGGSCTGIDVSQPMIDAARQRARREDSRAEFVRGDAQSHDFSPRRFDAIVSRFGVMFFEDAPRAFTNLRLASDRAASLRLLVWRCPSDNPFMTTAERAAAPLLPDLPSRREEEPGQFAFADPRRVHSILAASGWGDIAVRAVDMECSFPEANLLDYIAQMGPVGRHLQTLDDATRTPVLQRIREAFDPFVHGDEVRFTASCWMVGARNPHA
jgi:SAM-dependent methyltransferase